MKTTTSRWQELDQRIRQLAEEQATRDFEVGQLLLALERDGGYVMLGCRSLADYAATVLGWKAHTFAERMRVAHRLEELRLISAEHAAGRMSFTVARDLTRVAVPENEIEWIEWASG